MQRVIILLLLEMALFWPGSYNNTRKEASPQVSIQSPLLGQALQGLVAAESTPTPLPPNPMEISRQDLLNSMGKGALAAIGLFALMGIYRTLQKAREKG